jgi:hypothetical protein
LLRERDDRDAVAFLKEFCLNFRHELREAEMNELVGRKPRKHHLPIFLAGLQDAHFRTVQGSARAVEHFGAGEAAPVLVAELKKRTGPEESARDRSECRPGGVSWRYGKQTR